MKKKKQLYLIIKNTKTGKVLRANIKQPVSIEKLSDVIEGCFLTLHNKVISTEQQKTIQGND